MFCIDPAAFPLKSKWMSLPYNTEKSLALSSVSEFIIFQFLKETKSMGKKHLCFYMILALEIKAKQIKR